MNELIVTKFGGSSLASCEQFIKVKNIINSNINRKYVIPSAPGKRDKNDYKITDLLYLCHAHVKTGITFDDVFKLIENRFVGIIEGLNIGLDIYPYLNEIKEKILGGESADYAASRGEYINGIILAKYLDFKFIDAAEIIIFDENGNFNKIKTEKAIQEKLSNNENVVIPGFYGAKENGEIVTFSRGGSDVTGAIIAAGVNSNLYENWTDVSGFLMADPRIIDNPKPIDTITYKELRELSYMGASVLHEEAIFPVREKGIPINIRNTNIPTDPGTLIINDLDKSSSSCPITGIAGRKNFTVIFIEKALMNCELGFSRKILSILEFYGVSYENMPSGIDTISLVIDDEKLGNNCEKIIEEIKRQCNPDSIVIHSNMAVIATVGRGMAQTPGVAAKVFNALYRYNINVSMIDQGASEMNILICIDIKDFEMAIKAIYSEFVE